MKKLYKTGHLLIFLCCHIHSVFPVDFDRRNTGVAYSAYVKRSENGNPIPGWTTYSLTDIKTMLEVIAKKFSNVATYGVGADNVPYVRNVTYHTSNKQSYSAEAAALINKERNSKVIEMIVGIWQPDVGLSQQLATEIQVALESAEIANGIYPETVKSIVFSRDIADNIGLAKQTLSSIRKYKNQAAKLGLKLGSRQKCQGITTEDSGNEDTDKLALIRRNIVNESDFIICEVEPAIHNLLSGPVEAFKTVKNDLLGFQFELKEINPSLHVMGQTLWPSKGSNSWENINNLKDYWEIVDKWASETNFTMWLVEAFDNPWKDWDAKSAHLGWWKLKENALVNRTEGYIEKIFEPPEEKKKSTPKKNIPSTEMSPWAYVGIGVGALVILFVLALITLLFLRVNKLQDALTKDDIREFMYGVSDETAAQQEQGGAEIMESALKFPYDKSYEIPKEKLKIRRDAILGTGQFGCVYKASIENDDKLEVALKMAKNDCPKSALKGLLSEIKILTYLGKHPNIVSILGAYTAEIVNGVVYVATELCSLGSLETYLRNHQMRSPVTDNRYANAPKWKETELTDIPEITQKDMIRWSNEIASGMEHLASKHVVHADLATRNVLLALDKTAKITDFGLSRRMYDYTNYVKKQQEPLPWRWMAIESLKFLEFSSKSDAWSYGVTLWEIYSMGDLPYPGLNWNLDFVDSLMSGLRMKCPPHASPEIYKIMIDCWNTNSNHRPTFTDLKKATATLMNAPASLDSPYNNITN